MIIFYGRVLKFTEIIVEVWIPDSRIRFILASDFHLISGAIDVSRNRGEPLAIIIFLSHLLATYTSKHSYIYLIYMCVDHLSKFPARLVLIFIGSM